MTQTEYVKLGRNGPSVSKVGLGLMQASSDWQPDDSKAIEAIVKAHDLGVNLMDTAEVYGKGHSEEVLGRAIKQIGRDNLVIATKANGAHLRYDELQRACKASLRRLGINEVDIYQVHWPDPWEQIPLKETMRAMEKLYTDGLIRYVAVSNFAVRDLEEARTFLSKSDIISNQVRYNVLERNIEEEVLPYCRREGIGILAWSPIAQGILSGKYRSKGLPKGDVRSGSPLFNPVNIEQIEKVVSAIEKVASSRSKTTAQVSLAWLIARGTVPIPGARDVGQSEENAGAADLVLDETEIKSIDEAYSKIRLDYLPTVQ